MPRQSITTALLLSCVVALLVTLPFPFAVTLVSAEDQQAGPAPAAADKGDRDAFLAGTTKDCPGCDLRQAKLKRRDLSNANLTGANLAGAVLHRAKLTRAKLDHAILTEANLNKTDLKHASLSGANLTGALLYASGS